MTVVHKSMYLRARAAPKLAWFLAHTPEDFPPPGEVELARMKEGMRVGELARGLFPDGTHVGAGSREEAVRRTRTLLPERVPLFEAALAAEGLLCRTDVLVPRGDGWDIVEVKSGTSVKEDHRWDLAFQVATARAAGLNVRRARLLHLNGEYVRSDELDLEGLFREEDLTSDLDTYAEAVPEEVERIVQSIEGPRPDVSALEVLDSGAAWPAGVARPFPPHHVTELYWSSGREWLDRGVERIQDLPDPEKLTPKQRIQVKAVRSGSAHVEPERLREWLSGLRYPLYHLDFETVSPAVPLYPGTRPYQRIPFQFSLHVEHPDGSLEHFGYLHDDASDPRPHLIRALRVLDGEGSVLAHNAGFERSVLRDLLEVSPEEPWLGAAAERLVDTLQPFQAFWYHHPAQRGSCSLKRILPALTGDRYEDLEVSGGEEAGVAFLRLVRGEVDEEEGEGEALRGDLERYCAQDTQGMVDIVGVLREAAGWG